VQKLHLESAELAASPTFPISASDGLPSVAGTPVSGDALDTTRTHLVRVALYPQITDAAATRRTPTQPAKEKAKVVTGVLSLQVASAETNIHER
jgi:hypothetical protein